jgi:N-formylglutamate amidohydrolase
MPKFLCERRNLVSRHRGTLPILLTCPHGGKLAPPGVPEREGPSGCCPPFSKVRESFIRALTLGVARRLRSITGETPYVVMADFDRKYIDVNRERQCGYESPAAAKHYDEYHQTIRCFIDEIRADNGGLGLLFDLHGTAGLAADLADVYLGTAGGQSVERLLKLDKEALFRRRSLRGFLRAEGYEVSPKDANTPESPRLQGGHTVRTYGSCHPHGLDAIQVEVHRRLRVRDDARVAFQRALALAIAKMAQFCADARTSAAFREIRRIATDPVMHNGHGNEVRQIMGGPPFGRGRLELRHGAGHDGPGGAQPGLIVLYNRAGNRSFLWIDDEDGLQCTTNEPFARTEEPCETGEPSELFR